MKMNKHDTSKNLEQKEQTIEQDAEVIDKTESLKIEDELQETNSVVTGEEHLDINLISSLERDIHFTIADFSKANGLVKLKKEEYENPEFKNKMSIIIAKINGWIKNRTQLKDHLKHILSEETTIQQSVHHKLHDENILLRDKQIEAKLRQTMWGPEIKEHLQYEPDGITIAPMENEHFKEINALELEIKEAKENIGECNLEENLTKLLTIELNKVYFLLLKEISLFKKCENLLKNTLFDINIHRTKFEGIEKQSAEICDHIKELLLEEIAILERIPNQFIELKKNDLLDEEHLKEIEKLELTSNFKR